METAATRQSRRPAKPTRATRTPNARAPAASGKREVRVDYEPPPPAARPRGQSGPPGRRTPGTRATAGRARGQLRPTACASSRSLTGSTRSAPPTSSTAPPSLPRLYDEDYAILALLDRAGLAPRSLIGRAVLPERVTTTVVRPPDQALPARADRPTRDRAARAHAQRRQAAAAVLAHPARPRDRPSQAASAGDLAKA